MTPAAPQPRTAEPKPRTAGAPKPRTAAAPKSRTAAPRKPPARPSARSVGHRNAVARPANPRRVSGPLGGTVGPGRVWSPARRSARGGALPALAEGLAIRTAAFVRALPDHSLLDRVVRGRAWIPILGVLLAGIVAMQVEVLKLSAGTGRALERVTALQSRNEQLRASVAVLGDDQRIERIGASMGMVMAGPTQVKFLHPGGRAAVIRALNGVHTPNAAGFNAALQSALLASGGATVTPSVTPAASGTAASASGTAAPATATTPATGTTAQATGTAGAPGTASSAPASTTSAATPPPTAPTTATAPPSSTGASAPPTTGPSATSPTGATGLTAAG